MRNLEFKLNMRVAFEVSPCNEHYSLFLCIVLQATPKKKVTKPYAPTADGTSAEMLPKEGTGQWSPQQMPASVLPRSTFGSGTN